MNRVHNNKDFVRKQSYYPVLTEHPAYCSHKRHSQKNICVLEATGMVSRQHWWQVDCFI